MLPDAVTQYVQASAANDIDRLVASFQEDAAVTDERQTHRGHAAIRAWRDSTAAKYTYTETVIATEELGDGRYRVTKHLEGDFPGGVVDLDHDFLVRNDLIAELVIS